MSLLAKDFALRRPLLTALALSFGAAISLGLSRFSYALLLPPMRDVANLILQPLTSGLLRAPPFLETREFHTQRRMLFG